ncbi:DUF29 domain-containing protein [Prosthecomicrobium pneumaticum]|nr:DUF29 domain-containing protein [Prosthecomicrobium pneumaticum]
MGLAKEKPLYPSPTEHKTDFDLWLREQIALLRQRRIDEIDLPNLIEELEDMAKARRNALRSAYRLVIAHLLKWTFQPARRSASWEITITRERAHIADEENLSPSLRADAAEIVHYVYGSAVREAVAETGLPRSAFPAECPWTPEELRDEDFLPD